METPYVPKECEAAESYTSDEADNCPCQRKHVYRGLGFGVQTSGNVTFEHQGNALEWGCGLGTDNRKYSRGTTMSTVPRGQNASPSS